MNEAELKFEREGRNGVAVVGSYLIDAARRVGIEVEDECGRLGLCDTCAMTITQGRDLLSAPTKAEMELLSDERRKNGERLSCQAKIEKAGEIVIMTKEKKKEEKPSAEEKAESYRKEFEEMPLEQKIAELVRLEAIALGETFSFILNSPSKVFSKVMDVMAEFGLKMDEEAKNAKTPEEHRPKAETGDNAETNGKKTTKKSSAKKKTEE
jgi:ferredoxin, 2Fe-2S